MIIEIHKILMTQFFPSVGIVSLFRYSRMSASWKSIALDKSIYSVIHSGIVFRSMCQALCWELRTQKLNTFLEERIVYSGRKTCQLTHFNAMLKFLFCRCDQASML